METLFNPNHSGEQIDEAVDNAFSAILKEVKSLLPQFPTEQLRTYVEKTVEGKVCYFFSPFLIISVDDLLGPKMLSIAKNNDLKSVIGPHLDAAISQCIYQHTAGLVTEVCIEERLEKYSYSSKHYEDALLASKTNRAYKQTIVHPKQEA